MSIKKEIMEAVKAANGTEANLIEVKINPFTTFVGGRVEHEIGGGTRKVMDVTVRVSSAYVYTEEVESDDYSEIEAKILSAIERAFDSVKGDLTRRFRGGLK